MKKENIEFFFQIEKKYTLYIIKIELIKLLK